MVLIYFNGIHPLTDTQSQIRVLSRHPESDAADEDDYDGRKKQGVQLIQTGSLQDKLHLQIRIRPKCEMQSVAQCPDVGYFELFQLQGGHGMIHWVARSPVENQSAGRVAVAGT